MRSDTTIPEIKTHLARLRMLLPRAERLGAYLCVSFPVGGDGKPRSFCKHPFHLRLVNDKGETL